ncbi:MAG: ribosome biogenesis GTPase Der [Acidobacteria bacterium]|nr:ribosome biogenesis GTPase Der [Acidobacteriota bacterium]
MTSPPLPQVVIVGRPNVGKSTLFNRILGRRQAIVGEQSGLTRDRNIAVADWNGVAFELSDTGGVEWREKDGLAAAVEAKALGALDDATAVLFVVDGREGPVSIEQELAMELHRRGLNVMLVVNKCDDWKTAEAVSADFAILGIDPTFGLSAEQGHGVGDMLDVIVRGIPDGPAEVTEADGTIRVAVVGRPNVGKSSLVNSMLGEDRLVVSDVSGTTRDAIDTKLQVDGQDYLLVDTAGIRRGARQEGFAEMVSVSIARRRMARADVALLVIDAVVGLSRQDRTVADEAQNAGCGLIIVVNKWDLVDVERGDQRSWRKELAERLGRMSFAEVAYTSALTGDGVPGLFGVIDSVAANRSRRVPTGELNGLFEYLKERGMQGPPGSPELKYLTQAAVAPPTFVIFTGKGSRELPASYRRYLENRLRRTFEFSGTPLRLNIRQRRRRPE